MKICNNCGKKTICLYADIDKKEWSCFNCYNDQEGSTVSDKVQQIHNKSLDKRKRGFRAKVCKDRQSPVRRGKRTSNKRSKGR